MVEFDKFISILRTQVLADNKVEVQKMIFVILSPYQCRQHHTQNSLLNLKDVDITNTMKSGI